jgi:hypothetical protein
MNEQIYNLSLLADQYAHSICDGNEHADWYQTRDQKFAELIVRECAKRVDYWESRQGEHTEDLLKHFGVE